MKQEIRCNTLIDHSWKIKTCEIALKPVEPKEGSIPPLLTNPPRLAVLYTVTTTCSARASNARLWKKDSRTDHEAWSWRAARSELGLLSNSQLTSEVMMVSNDCAICLFTTDILLRYKVTIRSKIGKRSSSSLSTSPSGTRGHTRILRAATWTAR